MLIPTGSCHAYQAAEIKLCDVLVVLIIIFAPNATKTATNLVVLIITY
jgi:hypothetical protein